MNAIYPLDPGFLRGAYLPARARRFPPRSAVYNMSSRRGSSARGSHRGGDAG